MRLIVDTWNVLHVQGVLPSGLAGLDLTGLGRLLQESRWATVHTLLVCDGRPQERPKDLPKGVHLAWSGVDREADDVIEGLISRSTTPRHMVVVSSDNRLRRAAKRRRCKWLDAPAFLRTILDDLGRPSTAPPKADDMRGDSEDWHAHFGLDHETLESLQAQADALPLPDLPGDPTTATPKRTPTEPTPPSPAPEDSPSPPPLPDLFPDSIIEQAARIARGDH